MKNIAKHLLCLALMLVLPVSAQAAEGYCMVCKDAYGYTLDYTEWTDEEHNIRHWCDNCDEDQLGGTLGEEHEMEHYSSRYDECTKCGYRIECEHVCDHDITYTEWDDCDWYEYCAECDELVDEGTEHGDYEYDDWEYYSSSRHRRYYCCEDCGGDDGYEYGYHDEETEYYEYDEDQHEVVEYCEDCDSYIDVDYEDHDFEYGAWTLYSAGEHRRTRTCDICRYMDYEYADHSLVYGSWISLNGSQHWRTAGCFCGYGSYEYADHADGDGDGKCDDCSYQTSLFSVTVPAFMTIVVSENGEVYTATSAEIVNHSTGAVEITDIRVTSSADWTLVPYDTDMANEKVDSRLIGFLLNGADGMMGNLSLTGDWTVEKNAELPLIYDAVVSATSEAIENEQVLTVMFVVEWA